jgi:uncharacterized protein YecE (DUF72 family)
VKLFVGQTRFAGSIRRYAERFDLLELRADPARLPRRTRLVEWASQVPKDFAFALVVANAAFDDNRGEALAYTAKVAEVLKPAWWVLRTPASLTPAGSSVRRLRDVVAAWPQGPRVAWEPSGPWDEAGAVRTAAELGLILVRDGTRERLPEGDVVYTRLRALGEGANVSLGAADRLAEELDGRDEAYVVVEGMGASRVAGILRSSLADEDAHEEEGDEEDEGEEDAS